LVLQHLLNRRIPLLKFFLKQQPVLVMVGLVGEEFAMRRHSEGILKKTP
jgi:hypothetical protein